MRRRQNEVVKVKEEFALLEKCATKLITCFVTYTSNIEKFLNIQELLLRACIFDSFEMHFWNFGCSICKKVQLPTKVLTTEIFCLVANL